MRPVGFKISEITREKLSKKALLNGNKPSFAGRKHTEESKLRMSLSRKGITAWNKGLKWSPEVLKKLSNSHKGYKMPLETRIKKSLAQKGAKGSNWRGGITKINKLERNSLKMKLWREAVFKRDNYTCQACGKRGIELQADHELPFAHFPDLRYEILNGRTLCVPCHKKTDTWGRSDLYINEFAYELDR